MGSAQPLVSDLVLKGLSKSSQESIVKIFHFSDEWKVVSVAPKNLEMFFSDILATASRSNTLYGLET